ncbi:hypothetical protein [Paenisporosarcina sp. TG-14]|uniref:hypothetical protein n=1 Tax=Paenisporosarcina sp. TG-14 TaxID=1231057 RepID=UPI0012DD3CCB|nr:hypothetical protein [Paenisporosarcina sp. TG-14]
MAQLGPKHTGTRRGEGASHNQNGYHFVIIFFSLPKVRSLLFLTHLVLVITFVGLPLAQPPQIEFTKHFSKHYLNFHY